MRIMSHQFHEVASPKRYGQRGLEEYITAEEQGDKSVYTGIKNKSSYAYLNNPVYRVGLEGDPAPGGLSSRSQQFGDKRSLKLSESALHLLHPTIDSVNVFITEKAWDNTWHPTRQNIENVISSDEDVLLHKSKLNEYNNSVSSQISKRDIENRKNRPVPLYDADKISDAPNGVNYLEPHDEINHLMTGLNQKLNGNASHNFDHPSLNLFKAVSASPSNVDKYDLIKKDEKANKMWFIVVTLTLLVILAAFLMFMNR